MPRKSIARYLNPWMFRRHGTQRRFDALRQRDGEDCRRCRRPMRFDLPRGHDQAPALEHILPKSKGGTSTLDNLCLCHVRCNRLAGDNTPEVQERMRLKAEERHSASPPPPAKRAAARKAVKPRARRSA